MNSATKLREIFDIGAVHTGGVQELISVVELRVARNLMSAHHVVPTGREYLGDARREVLVEAEVTWW